jgi:Fe-S cluster biogenesis protein NfuA
MAMDEKLYKKVEQALDNIRPYLVADGGNVKILSLENKTAVLELLGNCGSCPMSTMTLKAGVADAIKRAVPEIEKVEAVNITDPNDPNAKLPSMA